MPAARRTSLILAAALLLMGCSSEEDPGLKPDPSIPLESYDTAGLTIARADFCELIDPAAAKRALGDEVSSTTHYGNGDSVEVSPGMTDIVHEYSCNFTAADGTVARGWVFAPPITTDRADALIHQTLRTDGCTPIVAAATFGNPTVATTCQEQGVNTVAFRGLFVDAWLSCSVSAPVTSGAEDLLNRANVWCVAVAEAAHEAMSN